MNGRYLLDTNIVISLFANDSSVINHLRAPSEVFIPVIVVGELYYGARKSDRVEKNLERIEEFVAFNNVISCDSDTAFYYGELKVKLRQKGRPIPENDIWIAALAFQHNFSLVSRDEHFEVVDGLKIEHW